MKEILVKQANTEHVITIKPALGHLLKGDLILEGEEGMTGKYGTQEESIHKRAKDEKSDPVDKKSIKSKERNPRRKKEQRMCKHPAKQIDLLT